MKKSAVMGLRARSPRPTLHAATLLASLLSAVFLLILAAMQIF